MFRRANYGYYRTDEEMWHQWANTLRILSSRWLPNLTIACTLVFEFGKYCGVCQSAIGGSVRRANELTGSQLNFWDILDLLC